MGFLIFGGLEIALWFLKFLCTYLTNFLCEKVGRKYETTQTTPTILVVFMFFNTFITNIVFGLRLFLIPLFILYSWKKAFSVILIASVILVIYLGFNGMSKQAKGYVEIVKKANFEYIVAILLSMSISFFLIFASVTAAQVAFDFSFLIRSVICIGFLTLFSIINIAYYISYLKNSKRVAQE